jgi:hypothetical protein
MSKTQKIWVKPKIQTLVAGAAEGGGKTTKSEGGTGGNVKS